MPTKEEVLKALSACQEPELGKDIVSLGMVQNIAIEGGKVSFDYVLTTPACPLKGMMELEAKEAVRKIPGVREVAVRMTASVKKDPRLENVIPPGVRNIIAVGSGKGGVGKSTVACNLAVGLVREGAKVGLLDADIYGPNQPQMFGITGYEPQANSRNKLEPPAGHGVKVMSMGFLMDADAPVIWRGPMLHGAITQFLKDVEWGDLDYLVVDLPPGTGDVQITLSQSVPLMGAVIVTTPQSIALSDVRKAAAMFTKLRVPLLGVVENMGEFSCPHCRKISRIFSSGGAQALAEKYEIPVLGSIPLDPLVCETGEIGKPVAVSHPDSAPARAFQELAQQVAARVSVQAAKHKNLEIKLTSAH
ncbi:MAG: Mrp/NBP35 family ATP-binding protein [Elusimicrobia bacterium]|nr:Mrp/NBP35 family ATP-binding protein [Elusimicrobiota bacterium]